MNHLGRYKLERVIGRGAMGVVYEGWDEKLKRKVAVKTILKSKLVDPDIAAARFIIEAQNAGQLIHPNIVTVFDVGNEADVAYLVMELILGKELKTYLGAGHQFGIGEAVLIACQLLEALDYVHGRGIFHRDIKPANVMLESGTNRVRLTDFGVAQMSDAAGRGGIGAATMVGTPSYMSPEQIKGLPAGAAADLFASAVLLYQCLTLHKPFTGASEWGIWQSIVNEDAVPMSRYRAGIPPALEHAVQHALAKDPRHRPPSARAMIDELKQAIGEDVFDPDATRIVSEGSLRRPYDGVQFPQPARPDGTTGDRLQLAQDHVIEVEFWRSINDSSDPDELHLYLARYPGGHYADLARRKIARLAGTAAHLRFNSGETCVTGDGEGLGLAAQQQLLELRAHPWKEEATRRRADEEHAWELNFGRMAAQEQARRLAEDAARVATEEAARRAIEEAVRLTAEATQRRMIEVQARKAAEDTAGKAAEEHTRKAADEVEESTDKEGARRPAEKQPAMREAARNPARKTAVPRVHGLARGKQEEQIQPAAKAAQARPARDGRALAPEPPGRASAATDEVVMKQLRTQLAARKGSAVRSSADWTIPRIFYSKRWHLSVIGLAVSMVVNAAILLAIAWLFKGSGSPAALGMSPSEVIANGAPRAQPLFPMTPPP